MSLSQSPYILYSDGKGNIFEDTSLDVTGRTGWDAVPVPEDEWIELPDGGSLYELPGRRGIGIDVETGDMRLCEKGWVKPFGVARQRPCVFLSDRGAVPR